jgi:hypothetical protein
MQISIPPVKPPAIYFVCTGFYNKFFVSCYVMKNVNTYELTDFVEFFPERSFKVK